MRTTVFLDDHLAERLQQAARERGLSLSAFLAEAGLLHLGRRDAPDPEPFRLITRGGDGVFPGVDLDRTSTLLAAEDQAAYGRPRDPL